MYAPLFSVPPNASADSNVTPYELGIGS